MIRRSCRCSACCSETEIPFVKYYNSGCSKLYEQFIAHQFLDRIKHDLDVSLLYIHYSVFRNMETAIFSSTDLLLPSKIMPKKLHYFDVENCTNYHHISNIL